MRITVLETGEADARQPFVRAAHGVGTRDTAELAGIVGPYEGSKSRAVVASALDLESLFGDGENPERETDLAEGW